MTQPADYPDTDRAPLALAPTKSDADIARDIRARSLVAVEPLLELLREAASHGMAFSFNFGFDQFGRPTSRVAVTKELAS